MKKVAIAFALVLASLALLACGGGGSSSSSESTAAETTAGSEASGSGGAEAEAGSAGASSTVDFETISSGLEYTTKSATAKAGKVTIKFDNTQPLAHDVAIENSSGEVVGETELVTEGEASTVVDLKPGTYKFFCTVPGHREAGMEGTLTVK